MSLIAWLLFAIGLSLFVALVLGAVLDDEEEAEQERNRLIDEMRRERDEFGDRL